MTTPLLCERVERRHLQEKCTSKCVRGIVLSAFIYFLNWWTWHDLNVRPRPSQSRALIPLSYRSEELAEATDLNLHKQSAAT